MPTTMKKARLNCIQHLLGQVPYEEVHQPGVELPERHTGYWRNPTPPALLVPDVY